MLEVAHQHLLSPLTLAQALTADQEKPLGAPRHLRLLDDELVQLWKREKGWPRKLMVFMPPRNGKSETCSHRFPVWQLALDASTKVLFASYEAEFAKNWGRSTRRTIAEKLPILGVRIMEDSKAAHRWETSKHGGMQTAGRGGSFTGKGCDCLAAGTLIWTSAGSRPIESVLDAKEEVRVLGFNHDTGCAEWRRVVASRVVESEDIVEVRTKRGRVIRCTADHPVFLRGVGYRPAALLVAGDWLASAEKPTPQELPPMWSADSQSNVLPDVLPQVSEQISDGDMQGLSAPPPETILRISEGAAARPERVLLHEEVSGHGHVDPLPERTTVREVRDANGEETAPLLLQGVPSNLHSSSSGHLPMRYAVPAKVASDSMLFENMRERGPFDQDARSGELALQGRYELRQVVSGDEAADTRQRSVVRGLSKGNGSSGASREFNPVGQPSREPRNPLRDSPHTAPQVEDDAVAMVRRVRGRLERVYDIQVEGTHNFFADGILVHNCLIIDDPISNAEEANSKTIKDGLWDWWVTTALTRLDDPNAICVLIQTRWAPDDLAGRILASESADQWRVLSLPALAEEDDPLGRKSGEALWPEKFDEEYLLSLKRQMGSGPFAALYQQRPAPAEGFAVNPEWWQWYDKAPAPETFDEIIQSWDTTFDDAASSDFVCGGTVGRRGSDYFLLDCIHKRLNTPDTIRAIRTMSERWPDARRKLLEKAASATSIYQMLAHEISGLALIPPQGSKTVRLHWGVSSCSGLIENKRVWLPRAAGWARELVAEFRDFPNAANDDYVDMLTQALTHLMPHGWSWERQDLAAKANGPAKTLAELHNRHLWSSIRKQMAAHANRHENESDADEYGI